MDYQQIRELTQLVQILSTEVKTLGGRLNAAEAHIRDLRDELLIHRATGIAPQPYPQPCNATSMHTTQLPPATANVPPGRGPPRTFYFPPAGFVPLQQHTPFSGPAVTLPSTGRFPPQIPGPRPRPQIDRHYKNQKKGKKGEKMRGKSQQGDPKPGIPTVVPVVPDVPIALVNPVDPVAPSALVASAAPFVPARSVGSVAPVAPSAFVASAAQFGPARSVAPVQIGRASCRERVF